MCTFRLVRFKIPVLAERDHETTVPGSNFTELCTTDQSANADKDLEKGIGIRANVSLRRLAFLGHSTNTSIPTCASCNCLA
ncbi:unnamed protein product [Ixodes pacificus]